ncbi:D-alanine--D-alanine ligase [Alkalibacter rhizosphaerae]|uniref:D-alanine--D-alanine ligase n=1 Tax=Alkalibacter rhizosphaerae TaxID=2815577 RepID=A0A974XED6_9FIRM|nr:D-alanine--D-alanine ligase family protein [Alkalibacter rhizosphaerae]QSX08151.1 D-alanine--D-alanine ligase [Alkalibacter rhizosphaerae]
MSKIKVGIIFGGNSKEHEISLLSASNVMAAMDLDRYEVVGLGIDKTGKWYIYSGSKDRIKDGTWLEDKDNLTSDVNLFQHPVINDIQVFFPVLHGPNGEDGAVQGLLRLLNKPFVGCDVLASAVGMDKVICKRIFRDAGIPQGPFMDTDHNQWEKDPNGFIESVQRDIGYPCFVKPANMGSSVGITKAHNRQELIDGIKDALTYDRKILVEANIDCREIECAVLGNEEPKASVLGEIIPSKEFYDYQSKYEDGDKSTLIIPAQLPEETTTQIRKYAIDAFRAIDGRGLSRVDFFVERSTGEVFINEINTLPGFTNISMYPKLWEKTGTNYHDLIVELIELALDRSW